MARPTKYSDGIAKGICDALQVGATRTAASGSVGITRETFLQWVERYPLFSDAVTRAEAKAELRFTTTLAKAAQGSEDTPGDWRAAEAWLKRRRREEWGDNIAVRTDREAAFLLAELFPEDAGNSAGSPPLGIAP